MSEHEPNDLTPAEGALEDELDALYEALEAQVPEFLLPALDEMLRLPTPRRWAFTHLVQAGLTVALVWFCLSGERTWEPALWVLIGCTAFSVGSWLLARRANERRAEEVFVAVLRAVLSLRFDLRGVASAPAQLPETPSVARAHRIFDACSWMFSRDVNEADLGDLLEEMQEHAESGRWSEWQITLRTLLALVSALWSSVLSLGNGSYHRRGAGDRSRAQSDDERRVE